MVSWLDVLLFPFPWASILHCYLQCKALRTNKELYGFVGPQRHLSILKNYICPHTVHPAVNSNQWPIVPASEYTLYFYCFRLTARSLHIHTTIIFTLFFLYLQVNGCQETNEPARNSCTSTRRLPRDAEGGIKQQTSPFSCQERKKNVLLWQTRTQAHKVAVTCTTHDPRLIFPLC